MPVNSPYPVPDRKPDYAHQVRYDGDFYDDDLPPELFDPQEENEELAVYQYIAEHIED